MRQSEIKLIQKFILYAGLIGLPFIIYLDLTPFLPGAISNVRIVKEIFSYIIVSSFVILTIHQGGTLKSPSKWLSLLMFYMLINWLVTPAFNMQVLGQNIANIWSFRALADVFLFYFMVMGIASLPWGIKRLNRVFTLFCYIGLICSLYLFIQYLGLDQWQNVYNISHVKAQTNPHLTSFLGQTNFTASFLAILIPFIICQKRWFILVCVSFAIILTHSLMGMGMLVVALLCYGVFRCHFIIKIIICLVLFIFLSIAIHIVPELINFLTSESSGRFVTWQQIIQQITNPSLSTKTFILTGYGLGSYEFILKNLTTTGFTEAHNEYLEFFVTTGLIGAGLLFMFIIDIFKQIYSVAINNKYIFAATCSLFIICIGNAGLFMWQIEPHRFYSVFLLGIIFNQLNKKERRGVDEK